VCIWDLTVTSAVLLGNT